MLLSNPATYDVRVLKEASALSNDGYAVTLLAWDRMKSSPSYSRPSRNFVIKRLPLKGSFGQSVRTVLGLVIFYAWCILVARRTKFDVIHCNDVDTLFCGLVLRPLSGRGTKLVYDMHDLPGEFLSSFPGSKQLIRFVYVVCSKLVDRLEVVNERFVDYLSHEGIDRGKMVVVMNVPDEPNIERHQRSPDQFRIIYYGRIGRSKGVQNLVNATLGLNDVSLVLAGRGDLVDWVRGIEANNPNVRYLGWLPVSELREEIDVADLIPILYKADSLNAVLAAPNKLFDAIHRGIPVIANGGTYFSELVLNNECGLVVNVDDPSSIRSAIVKLRDDPQFYQRLADNCVELAKAKYSWAITRNNLLSMYSELSSGDSRVPVQ
jgi:glycosyltransferase involved in cell wall biosynthesis